MDYRRQPLCSLLPYAASSAHTSIVSVSLPVPLLASHSTDFSNTALPALSRPPSVSTHESYSTEHYGCSSDVAKILASTHQQENKEPKTTNQSTDLNVDPSAVIFSFTLDEFQRSEVPL